MDKCIIKRGVAEAFGTFVLVFFAVGTAVGTSIAFAGFDIVATALAFGLVIVAMAYTIGRVSGCHINPAVSIGALFAKRITVKEFIVYVVFQFIGATIGAALLYGILAMSGLGEIAWGTNNIIGYSRTASASIGNIIASVLLEIILTFVFVYVILSVTAKKGSPKKAGLVIGLTLTLVHLIGISFTGTSVNPARSFGPALMRMVFGGGYVALAQYWVFLVSPLVGGILAAFAFKYFHKSEECEASELENCCSK